jgi:hypothetical protein
VITQVWQNIALPPSIPFLRTPFRISLENHAKKVFYPISKGFDPPFGGIYAPKFDLLLRFGRISKNLARQVLKIPRKTRKTGERKSIHGGASAVATSPDRYSGFR